MMIPKAHFVPKRLDDFDAASPLKSIDCQDHHNGKLKANHEVIKLPSNFRLIEKLLPNEGTYYYTMHIVH